ncbi:MAG: hypothetical protein ABI162_15310 [Luteolibacter sp.]
MKKSSFFLAGAVVLTALGGLCGCSIQTQNLNFSGKVEGHITVGPAYNYITLSGSNETFFVDSGVNSKIINEFLSSQPMRSSPFVGDYGSCQSVYVEALVSEEKINIPMQGIYRLLRIEKVMKIQNPSRSFFELPKHPLPKPMAE